jgi:STE24 endopeptidase
MESVILKVIIAIITFNYVLGRILVYLNNKNIKTEIPAEAEGIYDQERYATSLKYQKESSNFSFLTSTISYLSTIFLLLFGIFGWLDDYLREFTEHPIILALLFFGVIGLVSDILSIPFELYDTFVLEEKYGFNKTTLKTFISDKIKGYFLSALVGGAITALIIFFYVNLGEWFWLYAWGLTIAVLLFTLMFYTSFILPLFNKLTPLEEGSLRDAISEYAASVDFKLEDIFVMNGSKRSTKANAFFSGLGPKKKIVLYDTLIEKHTKEELVAVLAHEAGHFKKKHTLQGAIISIIHTGILLFILSLLLDNIYLANALGATRASFHIGLLAFSLLYTPIGIVVGIILNMLSRKNEYEADNFAKKTFSADALIRALKKLSADNLSNLTPHPAYVFVYYSHPPVLKRIENLKG